MSPLTQGEGQEERGRKSTLLWKERVGVKKVSENLFNYITLEGPV